ncbi:MAG: hypothetical protein ACWGQW_00725 [bacterium]
MTRSLKELREWMREGMPIEGEPEVYLVSVDGSRLSLGAVKRIEAYLDDQLKGKSPMPIIAIDPAVEDESFTVAMVRTRDEIIDTFRLPSDVVVPPHHSSCRCTLVRDDGDDPSE